MLLINRDPLQLEKDDQFFYRDRPVQVISTRKKKKYVDGSYIEVPFVILEYPDRTRVEVNLRLFSTHMFKTKQSITILRPDRKFEII